MFLKLLLITSILLIISFAGLAISLLIKKNGNFPNTHISQNKALKSKGITCAQYNDVGSHSTDGFPGCSTCGTRGLLKEIRGN
jgi:hypothetical protein